MFSTERIPLGGLLAVVSSLAMALAHHGSGPQLSWTPATGTGSYDYGTIDAGTSSVQTFTLRNSGGAGSSVLKISLTGSSAYSITGNTCSGTSLGPKKTCTVTVQYAPTTGGQTDTATLTATSNKRAARASHTLTGSATVPDPLAECKQELAAAGLTEPTNANYILGTDGDDAFELPPYGTNDVICGFAGNDHIGGPRVNQDLQDGDIFLGGAGNDTQYTVYGGTFVGGEGDDVTNNMYAGIFTGGTGNDRVGGPATDQGTLGGGTFNGGDGNDLVYYQSGGIFNGEAGCDQVNHFGFGTFDPGDQSSC